MSVNQHSGSMLGAGPLINVGLESDIPVVFPVVFECQLIQTVVVCAHTVRLCVHVMGGGDPG